MVKKAENINKRSLSQRTRLSFGKNKYRGVNWHKNHEHWQVCIKVDGRNKYFGNFDDESDGLEAVNKAYAKHFPNSPELQQAPHKEKLLNVNSMTCGKW
jgi:hypothetical protein